jgi:hypothetical protein
MPLKKDEKGGGTNADGSKSLKYCSHCFQDGKFSRPDFTAGQMQQLVKEKMMEIGMPRFLSGFFTYGIPKLERWRS